MQYRFKSWAQQLPIDPQTAGEHLEALSRQHGGRLTPDQVLADARKKRSPLHPCFEWDDTAAAEAYRLVQARFLMRTVVVIFETNDKEPQEREIRAFVSLKEDEEEGQRTSVSYRPISDVMENPEDRKELLARALKELEDWQGRYEMLREFAGIFAAIKKHRRAA